MKQLFKKTDGDLRWGWKAVILIVGTILFGILLNSVVMTVFTGAYTSHGFTQAQALERAQRVSGGFLAQNVLSVLQLIFMLWLVRWLVVKIEKQPFDWFKLGLISANRSKHILSGILLAVMLSTLTIGVGYLAGTLKFLGSGFELFAPPQLVITLLFGTILALASGFGEEIAFRGYLQSRIAERYNPVPAVLIVAVLFALSHPVSAVDPLFYLATAILVGILFGAVFVRTGSLWMGIALHTVWNYLQIAVFAVRNSADERFFGAPLLVFDNASGTMQMMIEFAVILVGLIVLTTGTLVDIKHRAVTNAK